MMVEADVQKISEHNMTQVNIYDDFSNATHKYKYLAVGWLNFQYPDAILVFLECLVILLAYLNIKEAHE